MADRKRLYTVEQTITERYFYDPNAIAESFNWDEVKDNYWGTFEDFVIETFQEHDGSLFHGKWFYNDANPSAGVELREQWDDD